VKTQKKINDNPVFGPFVQRKTDINDILNVFLMIDIVVILKITMDIFSFN
jgi:hypothetical protein